MTVGAQRGRERERSEQKLSSVVGVAQPRRGPLFAAERRLLRWSEAAQSDFGGGAAAAPTAATSTFSLSFPLRTPVSMAASLYRPAMRAARLLGPTASLRTASTAATTPVKPPSGPAAPPAASANPLESSYSDLSTQSELDASGTDWTRSFAGLSSSPFSKEAANVLLAPLDPLDVEIKPGQIDLSAVSADARTDGIVYLPEISQCIEQALAGADALAEYRRILNRAFGPGGWGLAPRGPASVAGKAVSREYALVCLGRRVALSGSR